MVENEIALEYLLPYRLAAFESVSYLSARSNSRNQDRHNLTKGNTTKCGGIFVVFFVHISYKAI